MLKKLYWPATAWWGMIVALWEDPEADTDNCVWIVGYVLCSLLVAFCILVPVWFWIVVPVWNGIKKFFI